MSSPTPRTQSSSADAALVLVVEDEPSLAETIQYSLRREGLRAKIVLQVHDELVLEVPRPELDRVVDILRAEMGEAYALDVPLVVDVKIGENWDDMTRVPERAPARAS